MGYWDTSCLVKLYADEVDSSVFLRYAANGANVMTAAITRLELWSALRRKEAAGDLVRGGARNRLRRFDQDVANGEITVLARDAAVVSEFESLIDQCYGANPQIYLRTLDAIHLASARISGESEILTTDRRLREAAVMFGFTLFPEPPETQRALSV